MKLFKKILSAVLSIGIIFTSVLSLNAFANARPLLSNFANVFGGIGPGVDI